jgi:hypothetical protein
MSQNLKRNGTDINYDAATELKYPKNKPNPKVPYHNKKLQKLHAPQISHTDRLMNNFIIHQNLRMAPIDLKHLITNDNIGVMDVISLHGRQIIIMILRYPAFDSKILGSYEKKPLTDEVVATCPSYICAFDYQSYDVLDVVHVLGEVKCFTSYREYIAINIAETLGASESQLITYALTAANFKFQQIQPAFHIGIDRQNINKIGLNYITLHAPDSTNSTELQPLGRLIIYGMSQVQYYGTETNHDLLLTYNHFRGQDQERWEFHKSALIQGMVVDISKYTHTDIFPARDVEHKLYGEKNKNPMDQKFNNTIHRIVSLSMDNPNIYHPLSELLRPIYKRYLSLSANCYILHPDGRLELVSQDDKGIPLYSAKTVKPKEPVREYYYYPSEKVGLEVIYTAEITNPIIPTDGSLVFDGKQVTVKNNSGAYHLQPGNILKYVCLLAYEKRRLFSTPGDSQLLKIEIQKLFYSPDGKYLAIEIKKYSNYRSETYDLNGVILYSQNAENGRWIETSYISFEKYYGQKRISFRAADNQFGEHLGYNLFITVENRYKFPEFVVIPTPTVLAQKYNDLLGGVFPDLAQSNINNISKFLALKKSHFIDLQSDVYKNYSSNKEGYKHIKLNV